MSDPTVDAASENPLVPVAQENKFPFKIYAGNLPYELTDQGLRELFTSIPEERIHAQVTSHNGTSAGFGFIGLSSEDDVKLALEVNGTKVEGRDIKVEIALTEGDKEKTKYQRRGRRLPRRSKSISKNVSEVDASGGTATQADNEAASGLDAAPRKPKNYKRYYRRKKGKSARNPKTVAEGAIPSTFDDDPSAVSPASAQDAPKTGLGYRTPKAPPILSETELYIQNLPFKIDEATFEADDLKTVFTKAEYNVLSAKVVIKYRPRRLLGFVDVGNHDDQGTAIERMNGVLVGGRPIVVKVAYKTSEPAPETIEATVPELTEAVASEDTTASVT